MVDLFPSITPENDFKDDSYLRVELENKPYSELQSIAADHPSEDVHGRMSETDLVEGLTGLERI